MQNENELLTPKTDQTYLKILASDGTIRMEVPEGTEGSVRRDYETSDGKKGTKVEKVFKRLEGKITNIQIHEGNFGKNLLIEVEKNGDTATLSLGVATPFGEDWMKKLPNLDLEKEVSFEPFAFENDEGKTIKGVSIKQDDTKLTNYYFDSENKKAINGVPEPEGDTSKFDSDDWKVHFTKVRKFLLKETEKIMKEKGFGKKEDDIDF